MRVAMEIEVGEVRNRLGGASGRHLAHSHEAPQGLNDFDVREMGRMKFVPVVEDAGFDPSAERSLQEKLQQGGRVDHDHAEFRFSRMTSAAGVFSVTRLRPWIRASISPRVGRAARRSTSTRR